MIYVAYGFFNLIYKYNFPVAIALWNYCGQISLTKIFTMIKQLLTHCLEINLKT